MVTLNTTPNRGYQEPAVGNTLEVDVGRLIAALRAIDVDVADALAQIVGKAGLASPAFTGTPTAPTAAPGTDSGQLATTAFVKAALVALVDSAPGALDTLNELAAAIGDDPNFAATMAALIGTKADKASNLSDLANLATARTNLMGVSATTDNAVSRYDGATGSIQNSGVIINDNNDVTGARDISPTRGIKFPATQNPSSDANTLDDYREGQTTPTVTADTGTITTSSCTVNYTKVGRQVHFNAVIAITAAGTGTGAITMPLPFTATAAAAASVREVGSTGVAGAASIASGAASCRVVRYDNASLIVSGYSIYVSGTYTA